MLRYILYSIVTVLVSLYLFPFGLTFLPEAINTKNILALIGLPLLAYDAAVKRTFTVSRQLLGTIGLAVIFSLICFISIDLNETDDTSYATYIVSFSIWMFGAYTIAYIMRAVHGRVNFRLLVYYMATACVIQCMLALWIDRNFEVKLYVDTYIEQGQLFLNKVDRLYGIGASLDNAGVRFAAILVMMAALLVKDEKVRQHTPTLALMVCAFFIITVIGNMMSRTTLTGGVIALFYIVQGTGIFSLIFKTRYVKFYAVFIILLCTMVFIATYLYQTDANFKYQIRFAFEGFFNLVEKGEWRTDSTDKLNKTMWIWPQDSKTWIIGSGLFDNWIYGTDIGYCRFILYCGLLGFSVFALFFVYNAVTFTMANPSYTSLFFCLLILSFVIWVKVATDLFTFYALFYFLDYFLESDLQQDSPKPIFDKILVTGR